MSWVTRMTVQIHLSNTLVKAAENRALITKRSLSNQIQHWAEIGKMIEENPNLTYEFIQEARRAIDQLTNGEVNEYKKRNDKDESITNPSSD